MTSISITPGKNNVGAYINNINLNELSEELTFKIKQALDKYGVIFIKKQNLNSEAYQNFAESIGQLVEYPRLKGLDNYPFINVLERKPTDKSLAFGGSWLHQDTSYLEKDRPRYTMLMGVEIPEGQGNTVFSSGFNAYKKLPEEIKQKIEEVLHNAITPANRPRGRAPSGKEWHDWHGWVSPVDMWRSEAKIMELHATQDTTRTDLLGTGFKFAF